MAEQPYIYTMDPYPQQAKEHNKLYKFFEHLREGRLTATRCQACGHIPWPPRTICPQCISGDLEWIDLPSEGEIYAFTVQVSGIPLGFQAPLIFAVIDFYAKGQRVRLLSSIVDAKPEEVRVGRKVGLVVRSVPGDRVMPAFKLLPV